MLLTGWGHGASPSTNCGFAQAFSVVSKNSSRLRSRPTIGAAERAVGDRLAVGLGEPSAILGTRSAGAVLLPVLLVGFVSQTALPFNAQAGGSGLLAE